MAKKLYCTICKVNRNVSGTKGLCRECALRKGFKECSKCKKLFVQKTSGARLCGKCRVNNQKGWNIGAWGQPGLGKNR